MVTPRKSAAKKATKPAKKESDVVHVRLPLETIDELDRLAEKNLISRSAVIAMGCQRIIKSGI